MVEKIRLLAGRQTGEIVIIMLTFSVMLLMVMGCIGIFIVTLTHPEFDASNFWAAANQTVTIVVGAVVGYVAGRTEAPPVVPPAQGDE